MKQLLWTILAGLALTSVACDRGGDSLALAAGNELDVEAAAGLLAPELGLPNQPEVVMALADLWIDYTLLAMAAAEDSTLSQVDLAPLIAQQDEIKIISALRDSVIQVDTTLSEEDVRRRFVQEAPGDSVRARHILLTPPDGATQTQRDSVNALAEELLRRLRAGEGFEALATQYSHDPGSAAQGGDLGFFKPGLMVAAFDSVAFSLEPGELSDIVETVFGYHIIRVEERETPVYEDFAPQIRELMQAELFVRAESLYVTGVEQRAGLEVAEVAAETTREIAQNPLARISGRSSGRTLVEFEGGEVTVGELRTFMQTRQPGYRQQVIQANDQDIVDNVLRALAQRELLVTEARRRGIRSSEARQDSMSAMVRAGFIDAAHQLGLLPIQPAAGESQEDAIARTVEELLLGILRAEREVIPLGAIAFTLRQQYEAEVLGDGVQRVVERVDELRAATQSDPFAQPPGGAPGTPADPEAAAPPPQGG